MAKSSEKESTNTTTFKELYDRIDCDTGIIFVDTPEETRLIREVFRRYKDGSVQFWSIGQGLHEIEKRKVVIDRFYPYKFQSDKARTGKSGNMDTRHTPINLFSVIEEDCRSKIKPNEDPDKKHIYVLRDLDKFLKDPMIIRRLKDLIYLCGTTCSTIIVTGNGINVPDDIEKDAVFLKLKYPTRQEALVIIKDLREKIEEHNKICVPDNKIDASFDDDSIAGACMGLTEDQIINVLQYTMSVDNCIDVNKIIDEKKAIINKSDILEYWPCNDTLDSIGGFGAIKKWFDVKKSVIKNLENAEHFKADPPKGIMLLGVQGSGKTAIAKALAQSWEVGLIKLDIGKVFAGLVGESEKRMRQALAQIDAAGGVIIIDELDKGLSGAGSSDKTDGGTTNRVIGTLLTWLSEKHPGVFLVATANDITALRRNHPELLRKGRFDEIWFSDVPTQEEREEIFKIHLKKRGRNPDRIDCKKLAEYKYNDSGTEYDITGAEIECSINDAIQEKFSQGGGKKLVIDSKDDIVTQDILDQLKVTKPITKIAKETISAMRKWSNDNARNVSTILEDNKKTKATKGGSKLKIRASADEVTL
jgi:AAA+ superfamily predicted ATPase